MTILAVAADEISEMTIVREEEEGAVAVGADEMVPYDVQVVDDELMTRVDVDGVVRDGALWVETLQHVALVGI